MKTLAGLAMFAALPAAAVEARVIDGHLYGQGIVTVDDLSDLYVQEFLPALPQGRTIFLEVTGAELVWTEWRYAIEWQNWWWDWSDGRHPWPLTGDEYGVDSYLYGNDSAKVAAYTATATMSAHLATFRADDDTNYFWDCGNRWAYEPFETCGLRPWSHDERLYGFRVQTDQASFSWKLYDTTAEAVPEPAAWTLMILGMGLAGAALRLRPARVAV